MTARSEGVAIRVDDENIAGTLLAPSSKMPGVLFVHGWGGSQQRDIARAKGLAGLGCICLTFDMRGHEGTVEQQLQVTREDNLRDLIAAYDLLASQPAIDPDAIAVVGTSYGGYLAAILTTMRKVKWLALRVPALYRDAEWGIPKRSLDRTDLSVYRSQFVPSGENRALAACMEFTGDVLIVESEHDDFVPHSTIMSYRAAFQNTHSLAHRIIDGADHALSSEGCQENYTKLLVDWATEMVIGSRIGSAYPQLNR
ncbi:alpha/beta hydrolase family protein [Pseudomonas matsuisoli]|uniref:Alpha/beta hydrolase n=1 Tax=Pseudomonas matsuisoli TaxID=1515666 RepID=A0A917UTS0_9PSED|nr:alpha/beta fold hydrolase [Pseudomonas matsuisoli]GGJ84917.1 alpha/beta hydrolase [Pseudomonas matsuisoli]